MDLTSKRCRAKAQAMIGRLCDHYDRAELTAGGEFWQQIDQLDRRFGVALAKRPITDVEIARACSEMERGFTLALRAEQARAAAAQSR